MGIGTHTMPYEGKTNVWLTPPFILEALGPFDLDPCAAPAPRPWATAKLHYDITQGEDGLNLPWEGAVWLNPPYGPHTWKWLEKLADHGNGVALTFARTETAGYFSQVWERADAVMFLKGRLHFHLPDGRQASGNSGGPSVLIAYGLPNVERLERSGLRGALVKGWTIK